MQNVIMLSAAVHELSCWQSDNAENNTAIASAGTNY